MRVDTELVRQLAEMLDENDLSEIEVEDNGRRIVVKRKLGVARRARGGSAPAAGRAAPRRRRPRRPPRRSPADHPGAVKSPMVGTVFLSAEPGARAVRRGRRRR